MNIQQFTQKFGFSQRDTFAAEKMYSGLEKNESDWIKELKGKFSFNFTEEDKSKNNSRKNKAE
jgi:hypothetical protein